MKKTKRFTAILLAAVLLGGCGVSQEDYDSVSQELNSANGKISELESQIKTIQEEYNSYKEAMSQYEDVLQYAEEIRDFGNLKTEIGKMQEEKSQIESDIQELQAQWQELEQKIEAAKNPKPVSEVLVYSDESVEIYFSEVTSNGVVFEVKNMTDINLTFQASSVAINGVSTNDITMSDDVAPQSIGKIVARCSDFSTSEKVYTVSGQLRVIDFSGSWTTYDAKFVNVEIE